MAVEMLCAICMEPIELDENNTWVHEDETQDKLHKVKPIRKTECC